MKRLDRLILVEVLGPWLFGTVLFTVLILSGQFLFQLTNYIVKGISPITIGWLLILNMPSVLVLTFPMATLLSMLLGFGRLSGESEITAVRACGTSLYRIMLPVAVFGVVVSILTFVANEFVVPAASLQAVSLKDDIIKNLEGKEEKATWYPIVGKDGKLQAQVVARGFDLANRVLTGVTILSYGKDGKRTFILDADKLEFKDQNEWKIVGKATVSAQDGRLIYKIESGVWPQEVPQLTAKPEDLIANTLKDLQAKSMGELRAMINEAEHSGAVTKSQIRNLQYGYWNKIALPMAGLVYALVGAPLGIRNHRTGAASGFWIAILIIFGYFLLGNVMGIVANGGAVPPSVAAFTPLVIGLIVSSITIHLKNR